MMSRLRPEDLIGFERDGEPKHTLFGIVFPLVRRSDGRKLAVYFDLEKRCFIPSTNPPEGMGAMQDLHPDSLQPLMPLLSPKDIAYATAEALEHKRQQPGGAG